MSTEPVDISIYSPTVPERSKVLVILDRGRNASRFDYQPGANQLGEAVDSIAEKYQTVYLETMQQGEPDSTSGWVRYLMQNTTLDIMLMPDQDGLDCQYVEDISEVLSSLILERSLGGSILNVLTPELDSELVFKLEAVLKTKIEMRRKKQ